MSEGDVQFDPLAASGDDFLELVVLHLEGRLAGPRRDRLNALLAEEPGKRDTFVAVCTHASLLASCVGFDDELEMGYDGREIAGSPAIDASIAESVEHPLGAAVELPLQSDLESQTSNPPFPSLSITHYPLSTNFVGGPVFSYLVATVILGMMLLGAWAYKITHFQQIAEAPPAAAPSSDRPELVFVGRITGMKDCRWADPQTEAYAGASVPLGRKYALASGLMEITYTTGAKVILEGPCTYEVESRAGGYLSLGKLTAKVEKERSGVRGQRSDNYPLSTIHYPLFSVRTPTAVVTDLGTEFGVEVNREGNTISHVFRGLVRVQVVDGNGREKDVVLRENESARVEKGEAAGSIRVLRFEEGDSMPKFARRLAKPISFSGSYDGSYDPSVAAPPPGQSTWTKVTTGACAVAPNDDNGTPTSGTANFNDLDMAGRIQVSRSMDAGTFSAIQAYDEYVYTARIKFYSADAYNGSDFGAVAERATVALGFRDEYNGRTKGKAVFLGWFLKKADDGDKPGLWLVNGLHTDTGVKLNNVDYFDDAWHAYRVEKFVDADGVAKVNVYVDGVQVGSTVNYSSLPAPHPKLNDQGFGWFSNTGHAVRATVDFIEYGGIPEPSASAERQFPVGVEGNVRPRQSVKQSHRKEVPDW